MKIKPVLSIETDTGKAEFLDAPPSDADFVICIPLSVPLALPDNLVGGCSACARAIQFRPECAGPVPKLCFLCAVAWAEGMVRPN